jgi:hypothetical protein
MSVEDDKRGPADPGRTPPASGQQAVEELLQAAPGLARIAASMARQGVSEVANAYAEGASRVMRAASSGESTSDAVQETTAELRAYLRELIGVEEGSRPRSTGNDSADALRNRGEELLRRSADVSVDVDSHPAYMRILDALAPDEARILRFLAREGEQPSVDIRAGLPFASALVAQGCTMIAEEAGCRHADRVYAYLNNLNRLGLVWFSREALRDARRYQVLEAQSEVTDALEKGGRTARTVRRSIVLTPFGEDFCAICVPLD